MSVNTKIKLQHIPVKGALELSVWKVRRCISSYAKRTTTNTSCHGNGMNTLFSREVEVMLRLEGKKYLYSDRPVRCRASVGDADHGGGLVVFVFADVFMVVCENHDPFFGPNSGTVWRRYE